MSSLINTIPDNLYPEEDIPTSMNIFTNTESISHYSQMNTGKITYFPLLLRFAFWVKCDVRGRQQLSPGLKHLFALMAVALEGVFLFLNINILNIYFKCKTSHWVSHTFKIPGIASFIIFFHLTFRSFFLLFSWRFSSDAKKDSCPKTSKRSLLGISLEFRVLQISHASVRKCVMNRRWWTLSHKKKEKKRNPPADSWKGYSGVLKKNLSYKCGQTTKTADSLIVGDDSAT